MSEHRQAPEEISAREASREACPSRPLIDIRTAQERLAGIPTGSVQMKMDDLLRQSREPDSGLSGGGYVLCAEGVRSLAAVKRLRAAGFSDFSSVSGGFLAWKRAQLPIGYPADFSAAQADRYARHLVMPQVGAEGQRKLLSSRILLAGLGGLNSPVALYLAAAGVGTLGMVDFDRVERSNLQRQVLHGEQSLGRLKAESASERIADLNPDVKTVLIPIEVTADNAGGLVEDWDIIVDGTDNFTSRYALNDACIRHAKPLVYGAVMRFQGQVSVFWPARQKAAETPCFRCLFPREPSAGDAPGCAEAGVLGVLPGIVGTLQATEALKLVLGMGEPLLGRLLMIDALTMEFRKMRLPRDPECRACGSQRP